jgi:hypothetical protein
MAWRSIVDGAWTSVDVRVRKPQLRLEIDGDGRSNFHGLLEQFSSEPAQPDDATFTVPAVHIHPLALSGGTSNGGRNADAAAGHARGGARCRSARLTMTDGVASSRVTVTAPRAATGATDTVVPLKLELDIAKCAGLGATPCNGATRSHAAALPTRMAQASSSRNEGLSSKRANSSAGTGRENRKPCW